LGTAILAVQAPTGRLRRAYRTWLFHVKTSRSGRGGGWRNPILQDARPTAAPPAADRPGEAAISYTSILLAVVLGIVHAGLTPVIEIAGVRPNLVLVGVVLATSLTGFRTGMMWAFVAGLTANLLVREPLGSIPLAMLLVSALVAAGERAFGRLAWLYPVIAALAGSMLADLFGILAFWVVGDPLSVGTPGRLILSAAVLNAALVGVLLYPTRRVAGRMGRDERAAW
jgi:rod shape-determining protein MreD